MTITHDEARSWLTLTLNPRLTPSQQRALLKRYGLPDEVLAQPRQQVAREFGEEVAAALAQPPAEAQIATALAWQSAPGHHLVPINDPNYPPRLLDLTDAPLMLYVHGRLELLSRNAIAIVGARRATTGGRETARAFAQALAQAGLTVVSGLAQGIDAAAHEGALAATPADETAPTVAVIGTGIDRVYPASHRALAQAIANRGAIVTEFPLGTPALPHHFPRRNRLIAALTRATLVVEAALESGSLITARLASELGRDVFAIPGSIHNPMAKGCHRLIREGALLVDSVAEILDALGYSPLFSAPPPGPQPPLPSALPHGQISAPQQLPAPPSDDPLWSALGFDPVPFDLLVSRSGLPARTVSAQLLTWELEGKIARLPGDHYQRLS